VTRRYVNKEFRFYNWLVLAGSRQAESSLSEEISAKKDDKNWLVRVNSCQFIGQLAVC